MLEGPHSQLPPEDERDPRAPGQAVPNESPPDEILFDDDDWFLESNEAADSREPDLPDFVRKDMDTALSALDRWATGDDTPTPVSREPEPESDVDPVTCALALFDDWIEQAAEVTAPRGADTDYRDIDEALAVLDAWPRLVLRAAPRQEPPAADPDPSGADGIEPALDALDAWLGAHAPVRTARDIDAGAARLLDAALIRFAADPPARVAPPDFVDTDGTVDGLGGAIQLLDDWIENAGANLLEVQADSPGDFLHLGLVGGENGPRQELPLHGTAGKTDLAAWGIEAEAQAEGEGADPGVPASPPPDAESTITPLSIIETDADRTELLSWLDGVAEVEGAPPVEPEKPRSKERKRDLVEELGVPEPHAPTLVSVALECALLFGLVVSGELLLTGKVGSFGVHPHPYWLVLIPIAAARGVLGGVFAAALATMLFAFDAFYSLEFDLLMDVFTLETMREPILFFAVGFVVGEFRDAANRRHFAMWHHLQELEEERRQLREEKKLLLEATNELKAKIVDDSTQFGTMIRTAADLEDSEAANLHEATLEMVEVHCGATRASLFVVLEDGRLDLAQAIGTSGEELRTLCSEAESSPLVKRCLDLGEPVNGLLEGTPPATGPWLVAPIFDTQGMAQAVLCLDEIPVRHINDSTAIAFFGIAQWASASLKRISSGMQPVTAGWSTVQGALMAPRIGTPSELGERLRIEDARCSQHGVIASLLTVQADGEGVADDSAQRSLHGLLFDQLASNLRPSDAIFHFGYPGCYVVVLADTKVDGAGIVRDRMAAQIEGMVSRVCENLEFEVFGPDAEHQDLASLLPKITAHFRSRSPLPFDAATPVVIDEEFSIGDMAQFSLRLRTEWSLAVRHGTELYVVELADMWRDSALGDALSHHIERVASNHLRPSDALFRTGPCRFNVILPGATGDIAFGVAIHIIEGLADRQPPGIVARMQQQVYAVGSDYDQYRELFDIVLNPTSNTTEEETT